MREPLTLSFGADGNTLDMEIAGKRDCHLPSYVDAELVVQVRSAGFAGQCTCWAEGNDLNRFARCLRSMDQTLQGEATLQSMSPGELVLTVRMLSARGHVGVEGQLGRNVHTPSGYNCRHTVSFGFEIELSQLSRAARRLTAYHDGDL